ncbi:hypothetical protein A0J57_24680 [Sphingobium sp. 22B]|nr:hypothetical protein AXW74_16195 [Sphingobium sp. AM]KYC29665.1 hypothetical protein A0J57_24680 [Sphingobium sp. 22B]OAP29210.1 hypothetical protein A8O16_24885 [Sphingobium sp. 20006FA]
MGRRTSRRLVEGLARNTGGCDRLDDIVRILEHFAGGNAQDVKAQPFQCSIPVLIAGGPMAA